MRVPRIFVDASLTTGHEFTIEGQAALHITRVLRLSEDNPLVLFNDTGYEFSATIIGAGKTSVTVNITDEQVIDTASPVNITLVQALAKGEKMDWIVQKATELGVSRIQPVSTSRTVVKLDGDKADKKRQHWQKVMTSACEQSGRTRLVDIQPPCSLIDSINSATDTYGIYFDPLASETLSNLSSQENVTFYIGPEGGFTDDEIDIFKARDIKGVKFGSRILRTETAAIAALSAAGILWGDLR